ncbi:MAG: SMI1/KNR4 family protein [Neisseriaceae bacterium]|jgi:hypothetical protein|nr:MAG: SMI1/KNR4 family protein [Neisseriaceae bacterium]
MHLKLFQNLIEKWCHVDDHLQPVTPSELDSLEERFRTLLPANYRECLETYGPVSVGLSLLSSIVEQNVQLEDLSQILSPEDIVQTTEGWRKAGLPLWFIAFASQGSGDLFCFKETTESAVRPMDALVYYFEHEEGGVDSMEITFTEWLKQYVELKKTAA